VKPKYVWGLMVMVTRASKFTVVTLSIFFCRYQMKYKN